MRLRAKSGFWVVDWWRGVGCTMWNKARKARKEVLSTSSLGNCFVSIRIQERGVESFKLGRENSHSKFEKRMRACATLSDDEKESLVCW